MHRSIPQTGTRTSPKFAVSGRIWNVHLECAYILLAMRRGVC